MDPLENPRIQRYLGEVDGFLNSVPPEMRREILEGIEDHLRMALSGDNPDIGAVLEALGRPELVAEAARAGQEPPKMQAGKRPLHARSWYPVVTLVLLLFAGSLLGGFLGSIAGLVGLVLLWNSTDWKAGEKILATVFFPLYGILGLFLVVPAFPAFPMVFLGLTLALVIYLGTVSLARRRTSAAARA